MMAATPLSIVPCRCRSQRHHALMLACCSDDAVWHCRLTSKLPPPLLDNCCLRQWLCWAAWTRHPCCQLFCCHLICHSFRGCLLWRRLRWRRWWGRRSWWQRWWRPPHLWCICKIQNITKGPSNHSREIARQRSGLRLYNSHSVLLGMLNDRSRLLLTLSEPTSSAQQALHGIVSAAGIWTHKLLPAWRLPWG